jgi:hypothetical protein
MVLKQIAKITLVFSTFLTLYFFYYYLPSQNKGAIEADRSQIQKIKDNKINENKNSFINTEYKNQTTSGQIFTTRAQESYIAQNNQELIHLVKPYSFTTMKKDESLIEIFSETGLFDKKNKITSYEKNVIIKNKNYLVTANLARHISELNKIIISGNVIMKDITFGLSHILYCDTVEINTITNSAIAFMQSDKNNVVVKKYK